MTPDEAQALLTQVEHRFAAGYDPIVDNEDPLRVGYAQSSLEHQQELLDAAELLVLTFNDRSHSGAAELLSTVRLGKPRLSRLVQRYRDSHLDDSSELSRVLQQQAEALGDPDVDILQEVFLAEPGRHLRIGRAVLEHRPEGAAWSALAQFVRSCDDPEKLAKVHQIAAWTDGISFVHHRIPRWRDPDTGRLYAFYALMRAKPRSVRQATGDNIFDSPAGYRYEVGLEDEER